MQISLEDKKKEAVERMKLWGIYPDTIKQFENEGLVSESDPPVGACFWLNDEVSKRVKSFEAENNALVYHVIRSYTTIGEMESYLYVSDYEEEWNMDREDLRQGIQFVYVYNVSDPICSEFGSIGVSLTPAKGLKRTA